MNLSNSVESPDAIARRIIAECKHHETLATSGFTMEKFIDAARIMRTNDVMSPSAYYEYTPLPKACAKRPWRMFPQFLI